MFRCIAYGVHCIPYVYSMLTARNTAVYKTTIQEADAAKEYPGSYCHNQGTIL